MTDDFTPAELDLIEAETLEVGRRLFAHLDADRPGVFNRRWWDDQIMSWAMRDESVKVQMFRFVDVLPMLSTSAAVVRHLHEYFAEVAEALPAAVRLGLAVSSPDSIAGRALAIAARRGALNHARRFIAGTNQQEVLAAAMRERKLGRSFTLDILGEAVTSETEADRYQQLYLDLIGGLGPVVRQWPEVPRVDRGQFETLPRLNVSVKLSALDPRFDAIDPEGTAARVGARLRPILRRARAEGAYVHVDMESYAVKSLSLAIFRQILAEDEFRDWPDCGIVIQAYLRDAERDLRELADWADRRGTPVWVRLVKGAYWDYETVHAAQQGWPVPVFERKWQTDDNFERLTRLLFRRPSLRAALASHNLRSLAHGIAVARRLGISPRAWEVQMLYGMGDQEKQALIDQGHRVRIYMPYGELVPGMAYLVRRLLENTSNDSFLRASFTEHVAPETLLRRPALAAAADPLQEPDMNAPPPVVPGAAIRSFRNEPVADFAREADRRAMREALETVRGQLGQSYPLWIAGEAVETPELIESRDPSDPARVVGYVASAGRADVDRAVAASREAWPAWRALPVEARADFLRRVAEVFRNRRYELAAWQVFECGKPWREADADVCEAIDFCEYYARGALDLAAPTRLDLPGEENRFVYAPRGVAAVIAPWNFPLAILTGMTVAALVTGNPAVIKPAEESSVVGWLLCEALRDAGLPDGVFAFLPGPGEVVGAALVEHPDVAVIGFTGSRAVGLAIQRRAAEAPVSGHVGPRKVIAELGGKNAIIIDDDADLDEAVVGVVKSAFGYAGQKCSACSRAIVLDAVYDTFLARLVEATRTLAIGPAEAPGTQLGPVISEEARRRILEYVAWGRREGREALAVDVGPLAEQGWFVGPHIFADVAPSARIAQEEIFGPVLAVLRARDLDEALAMANGTEYALTGGIFSRSPRHLERAQRELAVGNLYLNRGITGALVARQPFGGFRMSGIGSKAGGPDYLLQFVVPRTITENTLRRGFAPPPESSASPA